MFSGKVILITGGTGSFGHAFTDYLLSHYAPAKIIIFSRDEMKQWHMKAKYFNYPSVRFLMGDVRDKDRLMRAFSNVDIVIHAAATKIVPLAEYESFECVKTNVTGAMNVIDCAIDRGVEKVVALSTDKASAPVNLYGASKLVSDRLFVSGSYYGGVDGPKFSVVRYGNVMGSRGSVIPFFLNRIAEGESFLPITDLGMTRFMITMSAAVELVDKAVREGGNGEIFVKKTPSMRVVDIAKTIAPELELRVTGSRPGEKMHEQMLGPEESRFVLEYDDHFRVFPYECVPRTSEGRPVNTDFSYRSDNNTDWMTKDDLLNWIGENQNQLGMSYR